MMLDSKSIYDFHLLCLYLEQKKNNIFSVDLGLLLAHTHTFDTSQITQTEKTFFF